MLSGLLNSERAIRVNIEIMRASVNMRRVLGANKKLAKDMAEHLRSIFDLARTL